MRKLITVIIVAFAAGGLAGLMLLLVARPQQPRTEISGTPLIGGPFSLIDQNGKRVTDQTFHGRYRLVFFGYTHCPDVCPTELQVMAAAMSELGAEAKQVVPLFISVDPHRDTPAVLKAYLSNFGANIVGLTGTEQEVSKIAREYKVAYSVHKDDSGSSDYSVDHSTIIYLMGPDGKYLDHIDFGTGASEMEAIIKRYL